MRLSYAGQRMLALSKGKENIDDFPEVESIRIYNVSRDLTIRCNQNNLSYYLKNINDLTTSGVKAYMTDSTKRNLIENLIINSCWYCPK